MQVIRVISGDNELASLEFQKHYRLPIVHLLDANREFEKRYNRNGWPFLMLANQKGQVVYKATGILDSEMPKITKLLEEMLAEKAEVKTATDKVIMDGVSYMPATLERSGEREKALRLDRFSSLACGPDGKICVVFTTNRNGNSDVFIRVFDGTSWSEDKPVAATAADEYDGIVIVDKQNKVWVSWTSNADKKNYNIFVTSFKDTNETIKTRQITYADDDAMHARMACDDKNRVWVTYYKWHKLSGISRDKEIYVRYFDGAGWSNEIHVSPTDVPEYEDHSDPAIAASADGAVVCWSWDFHQPKGYTKEAREPTIFVRTIGNDLVLGKSIAVSGEQIDLTPAIAVGKDNRICCAWDSLGGQRKTLCARGMNIAAEAVRTETSNLSGQVVNVCSPSFAVSPNGTVSLLWSQTSDGKQWVLKQAEFDSNRTLWSQARTIESKGNPRYCSAGYDPGGQLWVAYSLQTDIGREITVRKLTETDFK